MNCYPHCIAVINRRPRRQKRRTAGGMRSIDLPRKGLRPDIHTLRGAKLSIPTAGFEKVSVVSKIGRILIVWALGGCRMRRLFLAVAMIPFLAASSDAYPINVEGWEVRYFPMTGAAPTGCIMSANFQDGTRFSLLVTTKYEWALGLFNASWNLKKDGETDVAVQVDQRFVASGKATHYDTNLAFLPLTGVTTFRALQTGHRLDLQTPYGKLNFQLTGSGKAMYAVLECVKTFAPPSSNQPRTAQPPPQDDFQRLSQGEATALVTNLLNSAGVRDYRLIPPKSPNDSVAYSLADGTIGIFSAARGLGTRTADDWAATVIAKLSELCKGGEFMSGKQPVPSVDGSVVRKVMTTCRAAETSATETTIIRRSDGFLMDLTLFLPDGGAGMSDGKERDTAGRCSTAVEGKPLTARHRFHGGGGECVSS